MSTLSRVRAGDGEGEGAVVPETHAGTYAETSPSGSVGHLAGLDLDLPAQAAADRPRTWRFPIVLGAVGVLAGAGLAALTGQPAPVQPPDVVTRVELADVGLAPSPTARLSVTIRNAGGAPARIGPLWTSGGGLPSGPLTLDEAAGHDLSLAAGQVRRLTASAPLVCPDPRAAAIGSRTGGSDGALRAWLEVTSGRQVVRTVAVASGALGQEGGACAAAGLLLPRGWQDGAEVSSVRVSGQSLEVTLPRMPGPYRRVIAVRADGWFLPADPLGQDVGAAPVFLHLERPSPACWDIGNRPRISTGLEVMLLDRHSGLAGSYIEVGPVLARWLAQGYTASCPAQSLVASSGK